MTRYPEIKQLSALAAFNASGSTVGGVVAGGIVLPALDPTNGVGVTIPGAGTWTFPLGGERYGAVIETVMHSLSAKWPSGIVGSITIEGTSFPKTVTGLDQGQPDVTDYDTTAAWQLIDITNAGPVYAIATSTGTMTKWTCAITAGAGGAAWNMPELGFLRLRAKLVCSVGGFVRVAAHAKLGS
jgi:hypothetical protein